MIEINLLSAVGEKPVKVGLQDKFLVYLLVAVLVEVAVVVGLSVYQNAKIKALENKKIYLGALATKFSVIQNKETKSSQLVQTISKLEADRNLPIDILYYVVNALPKNVWITRIEKRGNTLTLSASSLDIDSISAFMDNLSKVNFIFDVRFNQGVTKTNDAEQNIYQFSLVCQLR